MTAAAFTIDAAFVQQFTTNVRDELERKGADWLAAVDVGTHQGDSAAFFEVIGTVEGRVRTTRHADTPVMDTTHDKRWVDPVDYEWGTLIDKQDRLRMLLDPTSTYVQRAANAMNRLRADAIIAAFFANAKTGAKGGSTLTFAQDNGNTVAVDFDGAASGVTVTKLIEGRRLLEGEEVDPDAAIYCAVTKTQHAELLKLTQVVSKDYNSAPVIESGRVKSLLGINFIRDNGLAVDGSGYRRLPMWVQSGMHYGSWMEPMGQVYPRPDKSNNTQVLVEMTGGAARADGAKVVEIKCSES